MHTYIVNYKYINFITGVEKNRVTAVRRFRCFNEKNLDQVADQLEHAWGMNQSIEGIEIISLQEVKL